MVQRRWRASRRGRAARRLSIDKDFDAPPKKDVLGSWLAFRPSDTANGPHFVPGAVWGAYTSRVPRRTVAALAFRIRQPDSWCLTVETAPLPSQGNGVVSRRSASPTAWNVASSTSCSYIGWTIALRASFCVSANRPLQTWRSQITGAYAVFVGDSSGGISRSDLHVGQGII